MVRQEGARQHLNKVTDTRVWLDVSFADRVLAKSLGARWDSTVRLWYFPNALSKRVPAQWIIGDDQDLRAFLEDNNDTYDARSSQDVV